MTQLRGPSFLAIGHRRPHLLHVAIFMLGLLILGDCNAGQPSASASLTVATGNADASSPNLKELHMWMTIGERRFAITLADNAAARAFAAQLPLTLEMAELNGNEKHADLPRALPTSASRPGTIRNGDLMLYGSNTLVVFYSTFDSSYSYTRLGRADDATGLALALGERSVWVAFSRQ